MPGLLVSVFEGDFDVAIVFQKQGHSDQIAPRSSGFYKGFGTFESREIAGERKR